MEFLSIILGIPIGIFTSFCVWWLVSKALVPRFVFSDKICRLPSHKENNNRYIIKIENIGYRRAIDVDVKLEVSIPGLFPDLPHVEHIVFVDLTFNNIVKIESRKLLKGKNKVENWWILRILPQNCKEFGRPIYPANIVSKYKSNTLTLDDIMNINSYVKVNLILLAYDEFSNARKLYISKDYRASNIVEGYFCEGSMSVIPRV